MEEVVTFGEPMLVWIPQQYGSFSEVESYTKGLAGAELNVAIGVTRLGHSVRYVTRLGDDVIGAYIFQSIRDMGINTESIAMDSNHLTGSYFKTKVRTGDAEVFYLRKNSAASCAGPEDIDAVDFRGARIMHVTGIAAAIASNCYEACVHMVERARRDAPDAIVTFDPNIRKSLWPDEAEMVQKLNAIAFQSDIVMPGITEARILTGCDRVEEIADYYLSRGTRKAVIIKVGSRGAYYKSTDGKEGLVPGVRVDEIVDTVGAGDAFAAGVITGLLENVGYEAAVARGNAMGALMVTAPGDNEALPTLEELNAFVEKRGDRAN